jgi:tRNA(Ile)-lysidine synthase
MLTRFVEFIKEQQLFSANDMLVLAVSGGVDSVALVDLCRRANFRFVIAHFNFNLREKESGRDEQFVRQLAADSGVSIFVKSVNAADYASAHNLSIQVAARQLRYEWFETLRQHQVALQVQAGVHASSYVVTAHHLDDSVETMLMNLFRGTGITGLRGILPKHDFLLRPMLCFTKDEIVQYAAEYKLTWVEDSSNQLDKYTRNYFRNQLIPLISKIYPQVQQNLYQNLERFNDAAILYRESVSKHLSKLVVVREQELHIPVRKLAKIPAYRTILHELMTPYGFTSGQIPQIAKLLESDSGKQVLSGSHRVIRNRKWLIIAPAQQAEARHIVIEAVENEVEFSNGKLSFRQLPVDKMQFRADKTFIPLDTRAAKGYLDARKITFPLMLRKFKTGDYFYPLGMAKKKKLARFMIDEKMSKTAKEDVWVIESAKKIIWVVGLRIDDRYKITASTKDVLEISFTP